MLSLYTPESPILFVHILKKVLLGILLHRNSNVQNTFRQISFGIQIKLAIIAKIKFPSIQILI